MALNLTEEQKKEFDTLVNEMVDKKVKDGIEAELKKVDRKFTPGAGLDPNARITEDEADKLAKAPTGGFRSMGHFCSDVIRASSAGGGESEILNRWKTVVQKTTGYMEEGDLAQGGYTVPVQFATTILEKSLEQSIVRPRAAFQPMMSNRLEIPADVDSDHTTNYFGGIIIYRPGEGGTKTPTNPTFAKIALTLHKVTGLCYVSDELLSDSIVAMDAYLTRKFSAAIAFVEDYDFLMGTGANQPIGAFNSANPSRISVDKETGQQATTIVAENILKMWARLYPAGQGNAVWVANINTFPQLAQLSLGVGTGGIAVWMPAGGLSGKPYQTLMGAPLLYTEKMATLGAVGDIGLADFSQYVIGGKGQEGVQVASSIHVRFVTDETAFRFVLRYDGQPTWLTALTPKAGSSLSPFVVLAVRS